MHRCVVHEMPDELADESHLALVDLGGFDQLLLDRAGPAPHAHHARLRLVVRRQHEAGVVRTQTRREHARAPRPPRVLQRLGHAAPAAAPGSILHVVQDGDLFADLRGLLFGGVGDFRDRVQLPVAWRADAAIVAVTRREYHSLAPYLAGSGGHLQLLVHVNPTAAARTLIRERFFGHEVVGGFHAHADVALVRAVGKADLLPELGGLRVVLDAVHRLDPDLRHVLVTVLLRLHRQRPQAVGEEVDNRDLQLGVEVLQLRGPLDADEACAADEDGGLLFGERSNLCILLEDVASPALQVPLVNVLPARVLPTTLVHGGEPQAFSLRVQEVEVAAAADDAVVEAQLFRRLGAHRADGRGEGGPVQRQHFAPDELAAHLVLDHVLERERQRVEMARLHVRAENTWGVLEEFLGVDDCDVVLFAHIPRDEQAREAAADDEHSALRCRRHPV
mmetsp:Transcript_3415/g.8019  ORF Transcript_3415/g.8019 Transcript_3415/m.8019 type:complete len:448 (+) Transcript_3415:850-2193(+)